MNTMNTIVRMIAFMNTIVSIRKSLNTILQLGEKIKNSRSFQKITNTIELIPLMYEHHIYKNFVHRSVSSATKARNVKILKSEFHSRRFC